MWLFKSTLPPILLMLISFIHTLHDAALNLFCIWDRRLYSGFSSHQVNLKRRVSSHFVAKTTICCICMWKLSFLKYGNTHLISIRKIMMFSVPLGSSSRAVFHPYSKYKIPFDQTSLWVCSRYFPHPTIFLYSGLSNHLIWKWQLPDILKAKSTFSDIWFPTATPYNFKETNLKSLFYIYHNRCLVSSTSKGNSCGRNRENLLILDVWIHLIKITAQIIIFHDFKDFSIKYSFPWLLKAFISQNKNPWLFQDSMTRTNPVTRFTRQVSLLEQELFTLPEHLSSPPVFSGVRVTRSLVLYVCFVDRFFFWPLCCLLFDIRILISPLVSSNSSFILLSYGTISITSGHVCCYGLFIFIFIVYDGM